MPAKIPPKHFLAKIIIIITRNFRCKKGEIDLVVERDGVLVFVEVKTRNSLKYGHPAESITSTKIRHIKATAHWYIAGMVKEYNEMDFRFDVLEILRMDGKQYIKHIEKAF